ncbi:esterase-like activity of phytase family protein [Pseudanabaena sp. PCC 6802]|uniref:esterase-like activity of phytase family protein n=1 Tax=Pseudanabaena sp. PCC 6802 TaxID=118173 RepID=UPI000345731B|nr:esterase-like activity of phytase family protein [Pseudanabaena sp. PCC 6802]
MQQIDRTYHKWRSRARDPKVRHRAWLGAFLAAIFLFFGIAHPSQAKSTGDRTFLQLDLQFLHEYQLPKQEFASTPVGGLSAISYDRDRDRYYVLSDDRSDLAPARFYTLEIDIDPGKSGTPKFERVNVESVQFLSNPKGEFYAKGSIDPEGMAIATSKTAYISSEGIARSGIPAFIDEFELETGKWRKSLPVPSRYLPAAQGEAPKGIEDNLGFEALTVVKESPGDPFRIFAATESALAQDKQDNPDATDDKTQGARSRMLHYLVGGGPTIVVSEHLYPVEPSPGNGINGLTEILAIDRGGHFLSLERSFSGLKFGAKLFQIATGSASDISSIPSLKGSNTNIRPIRKQLLLDLDKLGIRLDNLESMTLGPLLADGSQSLILVSDNNFQAAQVNQFLLFRLAQKR